MSRTRRLRTTVRNCTRDEGGPFEAGSQVQVSSHRELLSSRAMVVLCQEGGIFFSMRASFMLRGGVFEGSIHR